MSIYSGLVKRPPGIRSRMDANGGHNLLLSALCLFGHVRVTSLAPYDVHGEGNH
jgi:hypothetical protein